MPVLRLRRQPEHHLLEGVVGLTSLQNLTFNIWQSFQPALGNIPSLTFGKDFNQNLETVGFERLAFHFKCFFWSGRLTPIYLSIYLSNYLYLSVCIYVSMYPYVLFYSVDLHPSCSFRRVAIILIKHQSGGWVACGVFRVYRLIYIYI